MQAPSLRSSWHRKNVVGNDEISITQDTSNLIQHKQTIKLLSREYLRYLDSYESTLMHNYLEHDINSRNDNSYHSGYSLHEEITESLRARLIDWILHCTQVCEMEERNIFFMVVNLVDYFYRHHDKP